MLFPPLKYTLKSYPMVAVYYRVAMTQRPRLLEVANRLTQSPGEGVDPVAFACESDRLLVETVAAHLESVEVDGVRTSLPEVGRGDWVAENLPPNALTEVWGAVMRNAGDADYEKKS